MDLNRNHKSCKNLIPFEKLKRIRAIIKDSEKRTCLISFYVILCQCSHLLNSFRYFVAFTATLKRIQYGILRMLTPSSVAGMQLIMWGENMMALVVGWVGECCSEHS